MKEFIIAGKQGFIRIEFVEVYGYPTETSYLGGYDVKSKVEIKSGNYLVKDAELWCSTGQIYTFFIQLQECYNNLTGSATFSESENKLKIDLTFTSLGQVRIKGFFQEVTNQENILQFEIESEQTYLQSTLEQLQKIADNYGTDNGINK
ncbi:WapI family immunity protein [Ferdinandcohnia sp. Marseille-Q9671]